MASMLQYVANIPQETVRRLKAMSPKLVPIFICLGALPVLMLFSLVAGWTVWKNVPKGWSEPVYLQYGDGGLPYSELEIASLSTHQPYDISLHLTVPARDGNYALGNFMVTLTATTYWNTTVVDVRKPAVVVPPAPSFVPFVSRAPRLIGMAVPLASSVVTGAARIKVRVEIGRKDGWRTLGTGEGRELSVFAATLHGEVRPQGLRRILAAFPLSLAIAATVAFFLVSALVLIGFLLPSLVEQDSAREEEETGPTVPPEEPSSSLAPVRRRSSRQEESADEESEPNPHIYPTPEPDIRRRARRRSSLLLKD
ncbi:hypothetical protein DFH11DRAFT_1558906 [Phellopilus nigrolimitatus]|nr:hypothetical protein DFH11DRAFT_1558906 [Phellopilus nigrolimitatus]